jgi:uncharacterized protein (DUF4415 family)
MPVEVLKLVKMPKAFRATGKGWQARMNEALKDGLQKRSPV